MTDAHGWRARAVIIALLTAFVLLATSCSPERRPERTSGFAGIGRPATAAELRSWDIDVNPSGSNLPPGSGGYAAGASVFAQRCAACHGAHGEGLGPYPRLIGRDPRAGFAFGQDPSLVKTVGNYWPYATTVFDYVRRAMPLTQPGSLHDDEVYAVVDYLLAENGIVGQDAVMNASTLPRVQMPARGKFVRDDRTGGRTFR
jgi:cytochrome c